MIIINSKKKDEKLIWISNDVIKAKYNEYLQAVVPMQNNKASINVKNSWRIYYIWINDWYCWYSAQAK